MSWAMMTAVGILWIEMETDVDSAIILVLSCLISGPWVSGLCFPSSSLLIRSATSASDSGSTRFKAGVPTISSGSEKPSIRAPCGLTKRKQPLRMAMIATGEASTIERQCSSSIGDASDPSNRAIRRRNADSSSMSCFFVLFDSFTFFAFLNANTSSFFVINEYCGLSF